MLQTFCDDKPKTCEYIDKFVSKNVAWTLKSTSTLKTKNAYWYHVNLLLQQVDGLYYGYQKAANGTEAGRVTKKDFV